MSFNTLQGGRLVDAVERQVVRVIPSALPSSTSASWVQNLADYPPNITTLTGYFKHKVMHALKAPNPKLLITLDQGEADCDTLQETIDWLNNWTAWRAQILSDFGSYLSAPVWLAVSRLSLQIAGTGIFTSQLRTSEDTFAATFADVDIYQRPNGTCEANPGLHLISSEQQANAILTAHMWVL